MFLALYCTDNIMISDDMIYYINFTSLDKSNFLIFFRLVSLNNLIFVINRREVYAYIGHCAGFVSFIRIISYV